MKTILFVCVENSNRSQMAEAFARMLGGDHVQVHVEVERTAPAVHEGERAALHANVVGARDPARAAVPAAHLVEEHPRRALTRSLTDRP